MSTSLHGPGPRTQSMTRDEEGYRTYKIVWLVKATDKRDGPNEVLNTPGLPLPGSTWNFGNDVDLWAWCRPQMTVRVHQEREGDPATYWAVEQTFSNKPPDRDRCQDQQIEDPLLEPAKISGGFVKYMEEATHDRFGFPILTSSLEMVRGPQVEFEANRPTVKIEQNVANLQLALLMWMQDTVNGTILWGLPPRTIKLSNVTWERKFHGLCNLYYTRTLEFEINWNTWDRLLLDEGTKVLHGHWNDTTGEWVLDNIGGAAPNRFNPNHFDRCIDRQGNPVRVVLDGFGKPAGAVVILRRGGEPYVAIQASTNKPLSNTAFWLPDNGFQGTWDNEIEYSVGQSVEHIDANSDPPVFHTYIAKLDNASVEPNSSLPQAEWEFMPVGIGYVGQWESTRAYAVGDRVTSIPSTGATGSGSIFVSKYRESNFALLTNFPLVF